MSLLALRLCVGRPRFKQLGFISLLAASFYVVCGLLKRISWTLHNHDTQAHWQGESPVTTAQYYSDMLAWCQKEDADRLQTTDQQLCPCFPPELQGQVPLNISQLLSHSWKDVLAAGEKLQLSPGGLWRPVECQPRRRVLVIIPYRDREHHLRAFLLHSLPIFHRQQIHFRIVVVEQGAPFTFNKAALMNAGYLEARKLFSPDCVLFVDVDTLIEQDKNLVICGDRPLKWAGYNDRAHYAYIPTHFGAAVILRNKDFEKINGFSNLFYGWGGEDDDFLDRINRNNMKPYFGANKVCRATLIQHKRDQAFEKNRKRYSIKVAAARYSMAIGGDGLRSVAYNVTSIKVSPLYTHIKIDLKRNGGGKRLHSVFSRSITKLLDNVFQPTPAYTMTLGECDRTAHDSTADSRTADDSATDSRTSDSRTADDSSDVLYKSRITCAHACDTAVDGCYGFQYVDSVDSDDFCVLLTVPCPAVRNTTGPMIYEIHNKTFSKRSYM